jgi:hypothetical protein
MDEIAKIAIDEFTKKEDGSWVCVKNSDVTTKAANVIRISPGMIFRPGVVFCGVDVAEALNRIGAK